ncbi:MAG: dihydroorotase [Pseudomonadota bacterium]
MTPTLIRGARILDPANDRDEVGDILITDGVIEGVASDIRAPAGTNTIDATGLCLAPGLIDLRVKTGEPGEEQRETIATASAAAVAGGITTMAIMPDTNPVIDDVALVEFIARRGAAQGKNRICPIGALTRGLAGDAMAELGLMREAGALYFSNGENSIANAGTMKRILTYAASVDATVAVRPLDGALAGSGVMNAGALAAKMGLSGVGHDAEIIAGQRDILLAENAGATLLLDQVSTPELLSDIEAAKDRGANIRCTVAAHHLFFGEADVGDYLTYCKVSPPFRSERARLALLDAVTRGAVCAVVSAHDPQPPEEKRLPFEEASFGAAGLETLLPAMVTLSHEGHFDLLQAIRLLTSGPADLFSLPQGRLTVGAPADLALFDPNKVWECDRDALISRSTNSPFDGRTLRGQVTHTMVAGEWVYKRA